MLADFRLALRRLRRAPAFTAVAVSTLALGLAATAAVFSLLDAVALRPFPYPAADRLVAVSHAVPGVAQTGDWGLSKSNYFYYGASPALERLSIWTDEQNTLEGGDRPALVSDIVVSPNVLALLGARAQLGRVLHTADAPTADGGERPVVLSNGAWRAQFGADPRVVGRTLRLGGDPVRVVGVLAPLQLLPGMPADVAVWVPAVLDPRAQAQNNHTRQGLARLRPGVSAADAERELRTRAARMVALFPNAYSAAFMRETGFRPRVVPLREAVAGHVTRVLWLVLGGVGLVLAIAAANVANLMLARREGQRAELAVQGALGATRARLAREAVAEGAVLACAATALALPVAAAAVRVTRALAPQGVPLLDTARVDWRAALVCLAVALLAAAGIGALPFARGGPSPRDLRDAARGATPGRSRVGVRQTLVVGQVALALVLLSGAGLLVESVRRLRAVPPGFEVDRVLTTTLVMSDPGRATDARAAEFWRALEARLTALPGVAAAGATDRLPLGGGDGCSQIGAQVVTPTPRVESLCVKVASATPGFFRAMGIAVRGAVPDWTATQAGTGGAVVTDALAARLWPGGTDPLGRGVFACERGCARDVWTPVRGVAAGVRDQGLDRPVPEVVYLPVVPVRGDSVRGVRRGLALAVRAAPGFDPVQLAPAVRRVIADLDPATAVGPMRPLRELLTASMARIAFTTTLLSVAAALAVALAAVGLYGTLAYVVGLRRREIGVRLALGARAGQVRGLVVRQSAGLVVVGLAVGLVGALAATPLLRAVLFGVAPGDPAVLAAVAGLVGAVAAAASWLPARRAGRVDPAVALRAE